MKIEEYKAMNSLTNDDLISIVKPIFPKFSRSAISMVSRGVYGVVLAPKAVRALTKAHPVKKENRKKGNKLTVRLDDITFGMLLKYCEAAHLTKQSAVEQIVRNQLELLF